MNGSRRLCSIGAAVIAVSVGFGFHALPATAAPAFAAVSVGDLVDEVAECGTAPAGAGDVMASDETEEALPAVVLDSPTQDPVTGAERAVVCPAAIELPPTLLTQPSATAIAPTCSAPGAFVLGHDDDVVWFVDGVEVDAGVHPIPVGATAAVEATPYLGAFASGIRTVWAFPYAAPLSCSVDIGTDGAAPGVDTEPNVDVPRPETPAARPATPAPVAPAPWTNVVPAPDSSGAPAPEAPLGDPESAAAEDIEPQGEPAPVDAETAPQTTDEPDSPEPTDLPTLALSESSEEGGIMSAVGLGGAALVALVGAGVVVVRRLSSR